MQNNDGGLFLLVQFKAGNMIIYEQKIGSICWIFLIRNFQFVQKTFWLNFLFNFFIEM